nr:hypothetical protein [Thaumasiovibrio occultus]
MTDSNQSVFECQPMLRNDFASDLPGLSDFDAGLPPLDEGGSSVLTFDFS